MDPIVNKVIEVSQTGLRVFLGNVSDYVQKITAERLLTEVKQVVATGSKAVPAAKDADKLTAKERRKLVAEKNKQQAPIKKAIADLEETIAALEDEYGTLETAMADPEFFKQANNSTREAVERYDELRQSIEAAYTRWEKLSAQL